MFERLGRLHQLCGHHFDEVAGGYGSSRDNVGTELLARKQTPDSKMTVQATQLPGPLEPAGSEGLRNR